MVSRSHNRLQYLCSAALGVLLMPCLVLPLAGGSRRLQAQAPMAAVQMLEPKELESTFPPSVYYRGKTASIQWRNAAAIRSGNAIFFAGLVDTSGYSSSIQETYQMYLILEQATLFGDASLPAGAYGAGFVGTQFVVMDLGGHKVAEGATQMDEHLARPRPLQVRQPSPTETRLYLGKRWVRVALQAN